MLYIQDYETDNTKAIKPILFVDFKFIGNIFYNHTLIFQRTEPLLRMLLQGEPATIQGVLLIYSYSSLNFI